MGGGDAAVGAEEDALCEVGDMGCLADDGGETEELQNQPIIGISCLLFVARMVWL